MPWKSVWRGALTLLVVTLSACRPSASLPTSSPIALRPPAPAASSRTPSEAANIDHTFGAGKSFGALTVFPVLAKSQPDLGEFTTLDAALEAKTAEVREEDGGGQVNALVLQNKGKSAVFVLAGTVVKGGKQDRQIGQDFVVGSGETVSVDAFCVEHGRWTPERQGQMTQGKFGTMTSLANSQVRAAGQHQKDQSAVWNKVAETNAINGKASSTGTLAATIDDADLAAKRKTLADAVSAHFDKLEPQRDIVGVAYAVGGQVKGVRWFANHDIYRLYRATLVNTAALEALTAPKPAADAKPSPLATADTVKAFVAEVSVSARTEERDTRGDNINDYHESKTGYGSKTRLKSPPRKSGSGTAAAAAPPAQATPASKSTIDLSADFVAK